jgi:hypothetical protein
MNNIDIEDRLTALTAAIADRSRARMLCLLMDGRAYTATELSAAVAGVETPVVKSTTPTSLQFARTCYDHMAGEVAVKLHDRLHQLNWLEGEEDYLLTDSGRTALTQLGIDCSAALSRRRFACGCLDWSERKAHLGGALGAAVLSTFIDRGWIRRQLESRELQLTAAGKKALTAHFGLTL